MFVFMKWKTGRTGKGEEEKGGETGGEEERRGVGGKRERGREGKEVGRGRKKKRGRKRKLKMKVLQDHHQEPESPLAPVSMAVPVLHMRSFMSGFFYLAHCFQVLSMLYSIYQYFIPFYP